MPMIAELLRFSDSDAPAYRCTEGTLAFRELIAAARRLAAVLNTSVLPGAPVAVYGHKELLMPVCIAACAIANRPYLPVDRQIPPARAAQMLEISGARMLLSAGEGLCVPDIPYLGPDALRATAFDPAKPMIASPVPAAPGDRFYLLFTSGSGGEPKGVAVTRANVAAFLRWERTLLSNGCGPVLNQAAFSFDLSVADLWLSLTTGRCESALEQVLFGDYQALFDTIGQAAPTLAVLTPSFAELLLASPSFGAQRFPTLQELLFCGEPLRVATVRRLRSRFPNLRIVNSYGPTECTVAVTGCVVDDEMLESGMLPVGAPNPAVAVSVRDPATLQELPDGEPGELVVVGECIAAGYLSGGPGGFFTLNGLPAYRTGDLGLRRQGLFYCCGRLDRQIKWRGVRIEPGEIEQILLRLDGVSQAAVVPIRRNGRVRQLRAFVCPAPGAAPEKSTLREALQALLPAAMIPSITILPRMPLTQNGKCDYNALEELP